jgi:hypothetical protein
LSKNASSSTDVLNVPDLIYGKVDATTATELPAATFSVTPEVTSNRHGTSLHPTSDTQAEVSSGDAEKAIRSAEIAMKAMNCYDTWGKAVERVQWVMETLSSIAEVFSLPD